MTGSMIQQRALDVRRIPFFLWTLFDRLSAPVVDGLIAVSVATYTVAALVFFGGANPDDRPISWAGYLLSVIVAIPLVARRRWPLEVLLTMTVLAAIYQLVESPTDIEVSQLVPLLFGLYAVGAYESRRAGLVIAFIAVEVFIGLSAVVAASARDVLVGNTPWMIAALAVGVMIRDRRERARLAEQRRQDDVRRMVDAERLWIARELHDVIANSVATINVQAGMAVHVFDLEPEQARTALREIQQTSKAALHELRGTLGVLRSIGERDDRHTLPRLDRLEDLIGRVAAAGIHVSFEVSGVPRELPAAVNVVAYRVVQEALTNVIRHAGPGSRATVSIAYCAERIELRVTDDGPPPGTPGPSTSTGSKLGLIGMRERVSGVGGDIRVGPRPDGGFEVRATLPTDDLQ